MTIRGTGLLLAVAMLAATPAMGQGVIYRGTIKDGPVPVPAPAPIPDSVARWYLRGDLGVGFMSASPSESGIDYGTNLYPPPDITGALFESFSGSHTKSTFSFGGGVGYYWSRNFRTDMTLEGRIQQDASVNGIYSYEQDVTGNQVDGVTRDRTKISSGVMLFNAYYDFWRGGAFTPYVGGGVGFSINQLRRDFLNEQYVCAPGGDPGDCVDPANFDDAVSASKTTYTASFAAAAMAGFTYSITPVTMLDINYRYLYIGGSDLTMAIGNASSTFSTGDIHEHQLRAGLRWNIQ